MNTGQLQPENQPNSATSPAKHPPPAMDRPSGREISIEQLPSQSLPKIISFETLARCGDEIWIENNGQIYRLRKTKAGKLILTK